MRRLCRLVGWFVVVSVPIGLCGEATAPLLLMLAADLAAADALLRAVARPAGVVVGRGGGM